VARSQARRALGGGSSFGRRERAPAALCRKIAVAPDDGTIEIWGDGREVRSFLYVDECVEGTIRPMASGLTGPTLGRWSRSMS
jgi:GDP-D-mannose 3',5'-epimerase